MQVADSTDINLDCMNLSLELQNIGGGICLIYLLEILFSQDKCALCYSRNEILRLFLVSRTQNHPTAETRKCEEWSWTECSQPLQF